MVRVPEFIEDDPAYDPVATGGDVREVQSEIATSNGYLEISNSYLSDIYDVAKKTLETLESIDKQRIEKSNDYLETSNSHLWDIHDVAKRTLKTLESIDKQPNHSHEIRDIRDRVSLIFLDCVALKYWLGTLTLISAIQCAYIVFWS
jgi:hypothetical protein